MTAAGYRCISYDLTGSALSSYTFIEQSTATLAKDAIDLMDALSIKQAVFVGHSMSGIVGPEVAATYPDRITGLALIGPVYPSKEAAPVFTDRIAKVMEGGMETMADVVPFSALGSKAQNVHKAFVRELVLGMEPIAYCSLCRVIAGAWEQMPKYADVKCPVLVIAGDEDKSAPLAGCEKLIAALRTSKKDLKVMKGVGHWQCIEAAEDTASLMIDFLA